MDQFIKFGRNPLFTPDKVIAVGDIHGDFEQLEKLLQKILPLDPNTHLVFLGDLINKGPNSAKVLTIVNGLFQKYPNQIFIIRGNHDWMLQTYCQNKNTGWIKRIAETLAQIQTEWNTPDTNPETIKQTLIDQGIWPWYFEKAISYYETPYLICTHAPLDLTQVFLYGGDNYAEDFKEDSQEVHFRFLLDRFSDLMWEFTEEDEHRVDKIIPKLKICGHQFTHHKKPRLFKKRAFIDTGCGSIPGRPLTALVWPGKKIIQSKP